MASTTLFAPSIRAVQPAFVYEDGTGTCTVYFTLNYNSIGDVYGIRYTLIDPNKSAADGLNSMVKTGNYLYPSYSLDNTKTEQSFNIVFDLTEFKELTVNQFYQIQIELKDGSENWSTPSQTSLIRPIESPIIKTRTAQSRKLLFELQPSVETIREYSYKIENSLQQNVFSKPVTINLLGSSINEEIPYYFNESQTYTIKLTWVTKHGYSETTSIDYSTNNILSPPDDDISYIRLEESTRDQPNPYCNLESGSLDFSLVLSSNLAGKTVVFQRADEFSNYNNWITAAKVELPDNLSQDYAVFWKDVHIQARLKYRYRLLWEDTDDNDNPVFYYNDFTAYQKTKDKERQADKIYYSYDATNKIYTQYKDAFVSGETYYEAQSIFIVDYEDIFLSDTTGMLAVRYNPKIANYKWVTQDSITNTLGGKYPIIRRNGDQSYRQFSLSGTIYLDWSTGTMGDCSIAGLNMSQFLRSEKCSFYLTPLMATTYARDISKRRILAKRMRELATQFLSNGSIKLFRSGEEEAMIVYLSNVSFTPNAVSGRHIYDFSATVTEVCEATPENMVRFGFGSNMEIVYANQYIVYSVSAGGEVSEAINNATAGFFEPYVNVEDVISLDGGNAGYALKVYAKLAVDSIRNVGEVS